MNKPFSTIGYGFLLEETLNLLDAALEIDDASIVRDVCFQRWSQKSDSTKERVWQHLKFRFLDIETNTIKSTPLLNMFRKIRRMDDAIQDLVFFQLCITTPILFETLSLLMTDSFLNTGESVFSRYHLDQLLEQKYERLPESTRDRVRSILVKSGRLRLSKSIYSVTADCPTESVLGYALYHDASRHGWRAPSTATVIRDGSIAPIFMCNRTSLIAGINKLAVNGHCEYHRHGNTDQIQLMHRSLEAYVDAWR